MKFRLSQIFKILMCVFIGTLLSSCVKDVDMSQTGEISLSPDVQIDLLIYDINESQFQDPGGGNLKTKISDTVRLEFLDDDYIQEDLSTVNFYFRHINSFPREIKSKIRFLSNNNREQFSIDYIIKPGTTAQPVTTDEYYMVEENRINLVRNSIQMVVELEVQPGKQIFEGDLDFASKGLFSFNF